MIPWRIQKDTGVCRKIQEDTGRYTRKQEDTEMIQNENNIFFSIFSV